MKKNTIVLLLISFLLFADTLEAKQENLESLGQKLKRGVVHSKEFALSKDMGNLLLFALSSGFLIYLPTHLSKTTNSDFLDRTIQWPYKHFGNNNQWICHMYYEALTLLSGYICLKTGKPYWEKLKQQ